MSIPDPLNLNGWTELGTTRDDETAGTITFTAYYDQPKGGNLLGHREGSAPLELTEAGKEFAVRVTAGEFKT